MSINIQEMFEITCELGGRWCVWNPASECLFEIVFVLELGDVHENPDFRGIRALVCVGNEDKFRDVGTVYKMTESTLGEIQFCDVHDYVMGDGGVPDERLQETDDSVATMLVEAISRALLGQ